ncbi:MAG: 5'-methylthioadenosine/adenosylhomocysteine nucleosidase [Opitutaceae bacterium]|jgi:adenosylhomocysteine nucleosidase|nr:5'-methylthioadenosine/adenosylhomocysteine nucleosidase [Opitutaceae bacterium]
MKFGILGALPQEVALIKRGMTVRRSVVAGGRTFHEGEWCGRRIVLALARVGKVSAALTTTLLLERFGVERVIFTGVAGALDPGLRPGDVVIAGRLLQHDMDARPLFPRFEVPLLGRSEFAAALAPEAEAAARAYVAGALAGDIPAGRRAAFGIGTPAVRRGLVISGDQFVGGAAHAAALRALRPDALGVEMEGAAVAQVCHEMGGVPVAVIRVISDRADGSAAVDFQRFVDDIAEYLTGGIVRVMLERGMDCAQVAPAGAS